MKSRRIALHRATTLVLAPILGLALSLSPLAAAQTFKVLYSFAGYPTDGAQPAAGLLMDSAGNLYGTTRYGGNHEGCPGKEQCGAVFKLDTNGAETVLYNFTGPDGSNPTSNLIMDAEGDLYGTTEFGGLVQDCVDLEYAGCGVVFKLSGSKETVLHRFCSVGNCTDGAEPWRGLVMDASGALYGTTNAGGSVGGGVAFKLVGKKETVLHSYTGGKDGNYLTSGLLLDAKGNLYGTDAFGGDIDCGCGVVFKLTGKQLTVLHSFKGPPDGAIPVAGVIMDSEGNLYGTTNGGGESYSAGTVFELRSNGKERVLHRFRAYTKQHDGILPVTSVVRDAHGNLFGTTEEGGLYGDGVVYEITAAGKEKILHSFCSGDCSDGAHPNDLIMDAKGNLYGTTYGGGVHRNGTVFKITLPPSDSQ
jgi:uncharacterized repeat protein (TIGR03803 family)